jgi:ribose transport system substrate-binding protein
MGQGIDATTQVFNALNHKPTTQVLSFTEVLVTGDTVDRPDVQAAVKRVYPPSVGKY